MRVVFRILGTLLVGLVLLFAWPASGSAESPRVSGHPHVYAYDSELHPGRTLDIQTGGGPPATTYDRVATPAVAGHVSDGPQVRPETLIAYGYTTYDQPAKLAQFDGRGTTAVGPVEVLDGDPPSPPAGLIAAKTGSSLVKYEQWPANDGFLGGFEKDTTLQPGTRIDRYGSNRGTYASPEGTPFNERGLPGSRSGDPYSAFTVKQPLTVRGGIAAPWKDSIGGGVQYRLPMSVQQLIAQGFLE